MKVPSIEEAAYIIVRGMQAFAKEIEELLNIIRDKLQEVFG